MACFRPKILVGVACAMTAALSGSAFAATADNIAKDVAANQQTMNQNRFVLRSVDVQLNAELPLKHPEKMRAVTHRYLGKNVSLDDLNAMRDGITEVYRNEGYSAATAYIPPQGIQNGNVRVLMLKGTLGGINIINNSKVDNKILAGKAAVLKDGEVATEKKIEDLLYDLNGIHGVKATGTLVPGVSIGSTALNIVVDDTDTYRGVLYTDNYGNKSTGKHRYGLLNYFYDIDQHGTDATLGLLFSNKKMHDYSFDINTYAKPFLSRTKIGLSVDRSSYELGNEFSNLGMNGWSTTYKLYGTTPAYESMRHGLNYTYGFRFRDIHDDIDTFGLSSKAHSQAVFATVSGHDRWKNRTVNFEATAIAGVHVNDSAYANLLGQMNRTDGGFFKLTGEENYYNQFDPRWTFKNHTEVQLTDKDIDSSEKMSVGGINGVRAYPNGEFPADYGVLFRNAFSYQTGDPNCSLDVFFDAANATDKLSGENRSLYGYGIEANYSTANDFFLKATYARRIGLYDGASKDANSKGRFWFLAGKMF